jgi:hypothetical protein
MYTEAQKKRLIKYRTALFWNIAISIINIGKLFQADFYTQQVSKLFFFPDTFVNDIS